MPISKNSWPTTSKRTPFYLLISAAAILVFLLAISSYRKLPLHQVVTPSSLLVLPTPTPTPYPIITHYQPPNIPNSPSYTLIFIGDSMTESLGENFDALRIDLKKYYPDKVFGLFNYGFGSSNILSVPDRLTNPSTYLGKTFPAILGRTFDIILIESLGNNPLSEYPLDIGLKKQTAVLDQIVAELAATHPQSIIVFVATIAPSQELYGKGQINLTPQVRTQWANERRAYIENHINYALSHNIPLINVYQKTLDAHGRALTQYLDPGNYIHPSAAGVSLISQTIADYLFQNHLLSN